MAMIDKIELEKRNKAATEAAASGNGINTKAASTGNTGSTAVSSPVQASANTSITPSNNSYIAKAPTQTAASNYSYSTSAPEYVSPYSAQIDSLIAEITGTSNAGFSYDANSDPTYQAYRKIYEGLGRNAMENTLGSVAANTGGIASTYATSAAAQANNQYMSQLAGVIPALENNAYTRYSNELSNKYNQLSAIQNAENNEYGKYRDSMSDYYSNRDFNYSQYLDDRNYQYQLGRDNISDTNYANEWNYGLSRDALSDERYNNELEYSISRDKLSDQRYNTEWEYQVAQDKQNAALTAEEEAYNRIYNEAVTAAQYGDYSMLRAMGIDTSSYENSISTKAAAESENAAYDRQYNEAVLAAKYGDYTRLQTMGIDTSDYEAMMAAENGVDEEDYDPLSSDVIEVIIRKAEDTYGDVMRIDENGNEYDVTNNNYLDKAERLLYAVNQMYKDKQITAEQLLAARKQIENLYAQEE